MKIIKEDLTKRGWVETTPETGAPLFLMEKKIENINPINASEDTNISLVVHRLLNVPKFAILLPDGGMLNFNFETLEQLDLFEEMIEFYDCNF